MQIVSNHHSRPILSAYDLSQKEASDADICLDSTDSFIRYRGEIYSLSDFVRISKPGSEGGLFAFYDFDNSFSDWQGILSESAFSAMLIRISDDSETAVIGLALITGSSLS